MDHEIIVEIRSIYTSLDNEEDETKKCKYYGIDDENEIDCKERCRLKMLQVSAIRYAKIIKQLSNTCYQTHNYQTHVIS